MPPPKKTTARPLPDSALIQALGRRIRRARSYWHARNTLACRGERRKALALYATLGEAERERVPYLLRVWLRFRSRKGFGPDRAARGTRAGMKRRCPSSGVVAPTRLVETRIIG